MNCACGCGAVIKPHTYWKNGKHNVRFIHGHQRFRRCNPWAQKDAVKERTAHERANKILAGVTECELQRIGGCNGDLHVAHLDGDQQNNAPDNLMKLCRTHHWLLDKGRIDLRDPVMPEFILSGSSNGKPKRRYKPCGEHLEGWRHV